MLIRTCSDHRSFYCAKGGVYTHYNRSTIADRRCVHTAGTAATQNVRCLVSINFGSTAGHLSLFFFIKPICLPCVPVLICQFAICRSVVIWWRQSKHANTFFSKWQTRHILESWNFKCQRGKKMAFLSRKIMRVCRIHYLFTLFCEFFSRL